ncbi:hypothetical protein [Flavobacterium sp.]|uniref:hypothetical protein n=1 Tax=Flavobacterium sp. TaxID=239 RepID=UPI0012089E5E|nr:hypothetical protein [Flavobacterium sp.]RZJ72168.1 MAG: hypothetical protein EOO49_06865 [Flavobacterium sp.]
MDTIDLKDIWQKSQPEMPNIKEVLAKATQFQNNFKRKTIGANLLLLATTAFVIWVIWYYQPQMWTTTVGAVLTVLSLVIFIGFSTKMLWVPKPLDESQDAKKAISSLRKLQKDQALLQTTVMNLYFLFLSAGILLYMIEYAMKMPLAMAILVYVLTATWFVFNWFVIRPKTIRKQREKIEAVIASLEQIQGQFES